ncbi:MAG: type II secretion system protein N [Gammaproteobacteria bacterium]
MKLAWRRYLAIGVAVYVLVLVAGFPASYVRGTLQDALPGLQLGGVTGTVFSGYASSAVYQGLDLGEVDWHFRPLALLLLRLEYHLAFSHPDNSGHVNIGIRPGGDVQGRALEMQLAPDRLVNRFSPVAIQSRGRLDLVLDSFEVDGEQLRAVTGQAAWKDAAIESPVVLTLGEIGLTLQSRADTLVAAVTRGGELGLSGEILLQPGNRYALDLVLRPGAGINSDTRDLLASAMQADASGGFLLKTSGRY